MLCENVLFLRLLNFFNIAMQILRIAVPIILIVKLVLDMYKGIIDVNDNGIKDKVINRIAACVIIFLVPTIIDIFLGLIGTITNNNFNYRECMDNVKNIDQYVEREELKEKLKYEQESSENIAKYNQRLTEISNTVKKNSEREEERRKSEIQDSEEKLDQTTASRIGEKYNLTEAQLINVAKVCQREQSTPQGAAAEAELMINKYILSGYNGSFYDYLFKSSNGRWWHSIKKGTYSETNLRADIKEAVRKVVNNGQRTLPGYINEHDYVGDIKKISTNGKTGDKNKKSDYVRDKTHVHTIYKEGSKIDYWVFYCFPNVYKDNPNKTGDPFGYTVDAKEKLAKLNK